MGKVIHGEMSKKRKIDHTNKRYVHNLESVLENDTQTPFDRKRLPNVDRIVTFRSLVKQTTTRNLYITIYIYFLEGRLCEVGAVRRGIRIVRRFCLLFNSSALYYLQTPTRRYGHASTPPQFLPISGDWDVSLPLAWNGLCDCHRAEITVMQFTGHSLPVHHSEVGPSPCPILSAEHTSAISFDY